MTVTSSHPQAVLLEFLEKGECDRATLLEAIRVLEQEKCRIENVSQLAGEWQLIWTSGTKQYQKLQRTQTVSKLQKTQQTIIQRIESETNQLENEVISAIASLNVIGSFAYINNKLEFIFTKVIVKVGILPAIALPMGNWAKGWLKTTYLDENWHIERGDRGGISLYAKIRNEQSL